MAWAAGLFEGEGSVTINKGHKGRKHLLLSLPSTDLDVVLKFHSVVGIGTVNGPYERDHGIRPIAGGLPKPISNWRASGKEGRTLLAKEEFISHFGVRRTQKIKDVIAELDKQPPPWGDRPEVTHCPHGHPYDEANTYRPPQGAKMRGRRCRACARDRNREVKRLKRQEELTKEIVKRAFS